MREDMPYYYFSPCCAHDAYAFFDAYAMLFFMLSCHAALLSL